MWLDASISKCTTPDPCPMLSRSDSKLYTNFEFCKEKTINIYKTYWSRKPINLWLQTKFQERFTYLEDATSGVQVGDIEQVTLSNLLKGALK